MSDDQELEQSEVDTIRAESPAHMLQPFQYAASPGGLGAGGNGNGESKKPWYAQPSTWLIVGLAAAAIICTVKHANGRKEEPASDDDMVNL